MFNSSWLSLENAVLSKLRIFSMNNWACWLLIIFLDSFPHVANSTATPQKLGRSCGRCTTANSSLLSTDTSLTYLERASSIMKHFYIVHTWCNFKSMWLFMKSPPHLPGVNCSHDTAHGQCPVSSNTKAMSSASPSFSDPKHRAYMLQLRERLHQCWDKELNWDLLPSKLNKVSMHVYIMHVTTLSTREYIVVMYNYYISYRPATNLVMQLACQLQQF